MDVRTLVEVASNPQVEEFQTGDTVKVSTRVVEGERERVQTIQGLVIRLKKGSINSNFTLRRTSNGVGVEQTFFLRSPHLQRLEVVRRGKVRRARLYYMRGLTGKTARVKERR